MEFSTVSNSPQHTLDIGRQIGAQLKGGEVIGLVGPLGSGKTHLIKGIASGAGAADSARTVHSPTFVIVNEYRGRFDIYHVDAYRLNSLGDFEMIGFDDYCRDDSIVLIEWADKVEPALSGLDWIRIELSHLGPQKRQITITNAPQLFKSPQTGP